MAKPISTETLTDIKRIGVYIGVPGLGDLLFIIPLFRALKERFPEAEVVFIGKLLRGYVRPIFDSCPYIDSLMEFHLYEKKSFGALLAFSARLRKENFDIIVDTQRKFAPSLLMKMGGPRFMVSYSSKGMFSDFEVPDSGDRSMRHTADVSLDLARALGIEPNLELTLTVPEEQQAYAAAFFGASGVDEEDPVLGIVPSASEPTRCWPPERFAAVANHLHRAYGMVPVCLGSKGDADAIDKVAAACEAPVIIEDFNHGNIMNSAALMQRCSAVVGNISGPLHIADAVGVPCVGIYGPHPPGRFGLLGRRTRHVCLNLDCAPCDTPDCQHRRCVNDIPPNMVIKALLEVL